MAFFDVSSAKKTTDLKKEYDVIIIGGGPGGITASIYAVQAGLEPLVIEKALEGGQINNTDKVENWPGFSSISGVDLSEKMAQHAQDHNVMITNAEVVDIKPEEMKTVILDNGKQIKSPVLIIATGSNPKKLGVPGEEKYSGKGISYCATCDGHFFRDKHVAVIGGGNSALDEALYLAKIVKKITVVQNLPDLTADKMLQKKIKETGITDFIYNTVVKEVDGNEKLSKLVLKNVKTDKESELDVDGAFVFIGMNPNTDFLKGKVELNDYGYVITNDHCETNIERIYAVGDVREKEVRQIVTAAADGAIALLDASKRFFQ
ncbi:MAG: thioredoxin-disulfide reductase [Kosmotoga sp.]|nr:MAG: thioredoxin-disulfide reductase [Kosmotoga sp.]